MTDIARIRALINEGKTNAEIEEILQSRRHSTSPGACDQPEPTLRALTLTMRRAYDQERGVGSLEVMDILTVFRTLWEEVAGNGDTDRVSSLAMASLSHVSQEITVGNVFKQLHKDMACLMRNANAAMPKAERDERIEVEARYRRIVGGVPFIWPAAAALAVAEACEHIFEVLADDPRYHAILTPEVLKVCAPILLVDRPTLAEFAIQAKALNIRPLEKYSETKSSAEHESAG
jgi:hypothetical protein